MRCLLRKRFSKEDDMALGLNVADKMSQDKTLQDKMSRIYRCGQIVVDKMLHGQNVAKKNVVA
jgi:xylose isomerase